MDTGLVGSKLLVFWYNSEEAPYDERIGLRVGLIVPF